MKFIVKKFTKCAPRMGLLQEIQRLPDTSFNTPMVMLYTRVIKFFSINISFYWFFIYFKGGSIPHLTREVLQMVLNEPQCIQVPLVSTSSFFEPMSEYDGTIADFVGLKEHMTYITTQDPAESTPEGHHLQNNIPIWTRSGRVNLNSDM